MSAAEKAGLMVVIGAVLGTVVVSGFFLSEVETRRAKVILSAVLVVSMVAGAYLVLYTHFAYGWFDIPVSTLVVLGVGIALGGGLYYMWGHVPIGSDTKIAITIVAIAIFVCGLSYV